MHPARHSLKGSVDRLLERSIVQRIWALRAHRKLRVLAYHGVEDADAFARQVDYLVEVARPISLAALVEHVATGRPLPPGAALVTFDDGERSVLEKGAAVLRARGVPAVAFVVAGLLGTDEPYWWEEAKAMLRAGALPPPGYPAEPERLVARLKTVPNSVRLDVLRELRQATPAKLRQPQLHESELQALEGSGIAVANHSLTHPCLDRCSDEEIQREVREPHAVLSRALGHAPVAFAYPNGNWDPRVRAVVADAGYQVAFAFDHALSHLPPTDPLRISRLRVSSLTPLPRFATILSGLHPSLLRARRAFGARLRPSV